MILSQKNDKLVTDKSKGYYIGKVLLCILLVALVIYICIGFFNGWHFSTESIKDMRIITFIIFLSLVTLPFAVYNFLGIFGFFTVCFNKKNGKVLKGFKVIGSIDDIETIEIQIAKFKGRTDIYQLKVFFKNGEYLIADQSLKLKYLEKEEKKLLQFLDMDSDKNDIISDYLMPKFDKSKLEGEL